MFINDKTVEYLISFLLDGYADASLVRYSKERPDSTAKVWIKQSDFFDEGVYGTSSSIPEGIKIIEDDGKKIPFFNGESTELNDGLVEVDADIVASSYFILSRYEELINPKRDQYGRFCASSSVLFCNGYGQQPVVDQYGRYLRNKLRQAGVPVRQEKHGIRKIWLTHDIDMPFKYYSFRHTLSCILHNSGEHGKNRLFPLKLYFAKHGDPYDTFDEIIEKDKTLRNNIKSPVESLYFIISASPSRNNGYVSTQTGKYRALISKLCDSDALLGIHLSYEAGAERLLVKEEVDQLPAKVNRNNLFSRYHYLRWMKAEDVDALEKNGISDDFTLSFADEVGFRVGTSRPYRFINPKTGRLTNVIIHPLQIMECTLDDYMKLEYEDAIKVTEQIIEQTDEYNGELCLLWHNTSFSKELCSYRRNLYDVVISYIIEKMRLHEN